MLNKAVEHFHGYLVFKKTVSWIPGGQLKKCFSLYAIMRFDNGPNIHRDNRVGSFHQVVKVMGGDLP
jgi:hypothetical protein